MSEPNEEVVDLAQWVKGKEAEHAQRQAHAVMVSVDERRLAQLAKARIMLAALVKRDGRVRITRRELDAIEQRSKLDVKVQENGDLVVTFVEG